MEIKELYDRGLEIVLFNFELIDLLFHHNTFYCEYKEKVGGQTRYYIRYSINGTQITKRLDDNGNMWLGNAGYSKALEEITKLQNNAKLSCNTELTFGFLKEKYFEDISKTKKRSTYDSYCDVIQNQLWEYKKRIMRLHDFNEEWFVFGNDKHLCLTTIDRVKDRHFDLSGVKRITVHEFRHSHVSLLINEYIKQGNTDTAKFFVMMSQRMGHTIEVMQKTYMHLFPTAQDEIVNLLDDLTFAS